MRKRIGSKLYDTDSAELICSIEGGQLFRKRTRDREWFAVFDDGTIRPLDVYNPLDVLLMETGKVVPDVVKPEPQEYRIRVDHDTYKRIADAAALEGVPMSQIVRKLVKSAENFGIPGENKRE